MSQPHLFGDAEHQVGQGGAFLLSHSTAAISRPIAEVVDWEDYGLPVDPAVAAERNCRACDRAHKGQRVEIGCIRGLVRAGTVHACMAVLAGVPTDQAVTWVRTHDVPAAVESAEPEARVHRFAGYLDERVGSAHSEVKGTP